MNKTFPLLGVSFNALMVLIFFMSCSSLNRKVGLSDDNILEEALENKIEDYTGLDIDLTPDTPESKDGRR